MQKSSSRIGQFMITNACLCNDMPCNMSAQLNKARWSCDIRTASYSDGHSLTRDTAGARDSFSNASQLIPACLCRYTHMQTWTHNKNIHAHLQVTQPQYFRSFFQSHAFPHLCCAAVELQCCRAYLQPQYYFKKLCSSQLSAATLVKCSLLSACCQVNSPLPPVCCFTLISLLAPYIRGQTHCAVETHFPCFSQAAENIKNIAFPELFN